MTDAAVQRLILVGADAFFPRIPLILGEANAPRHVRTGVDVLTFANLLRLFRLFNGRRLGRLRGCRNRIG